MLYSVITHSFRVTDLRNELPYSVDECLDWFNKYAGLFLAYALDLMLLCSYALMLGIQPFFVFARMSPGPFFPDYEILALLHEIVLNQDTQSAKICNLIVTHRELTCFLIMVLLLSRFLLKFVINTHLHVWEANLE